MCRLPLRDWTHFEEELSPAGTLQEEPSPLENFEEELTPLEKRLA
jgi:hypothetical protein